MYCFTEKNTTLQIKRVILIGTKVSNLLLKNYTYSITKLLN